MTVRRRNLRVDESQIFLGDGQLEEANYLERTPYKSKQIFTKNRWRIRPISVAAPSKTWVFGRLLAGIAGSNPAGSTDGCLLWVLCVIKYGFLRRADLSSRGVLRTVRVCVCMCVSPVVIRGNNNTLRLQWVGRKRSELERKKDYEQLYICSQRHFTKHCISIVCPKILASRMNKSFYSKNALIIISTRTPKLPWCLNITSAVRSPQKWTEHQSPRSWWSSAI